jgi:hypothetical protein
MTEQEKIDYKNKLKQACRSIIEQRITTTRAAINQAQHAANQEEKSSAGDKYETSRAMGHLEKDLHSRQLAAHLKELASLHAVNIHQIYSTPANGAFVECSHFSFFIACGLGKQILEGDMIVCLSPHAPLAQSLFLKKKNDMIIFHMIENLITDIY